MFHSTTLPGFSLCTHCHVVRASNQFTYFKFIFHIHYLLYLFCIVNVHRGLAPDHCITMPLQPESPSLCVKTDAFHIFFLDIYHISKNTSIYSPYQSWSGSQLDPVLLFITLIVRLFLLFYVSFACPVTP